MLGGEESGMERFPQPSRPEPGIAVLRVGLCIHGGEAIATIAVNRPADRNGKDGDGSKGRGISPLFLLGVSAEDPQG